MTSQKLLSPTLSKHWKRRIYQGSTDFYERNWDSDLNCLYLVILRQYTTVTKHCYQLPCTWTWCIQYCDCWYNFDKRPGRVQSITCELSLQLDRVHVLSLFILQYLKWRLVINICILYVITRYIWLGLFAVIVLWFTKNTLFYHVLLLTIRTLCLSHKLWINFFVMFCNIIVRCRQVYLRPTNIFNHQH